MSRRRSGDASPRPAPHRVVDGLRAAEAAGDEGARRRRPHAAAGSCASRSSSSSCIWLIPTARRARSPRSGPRRSWTRTGWWTVVRPPVPRRRVDPRQLPDGARRRRFPERVPQQPGGDDPVDGDADHHRRVRRLRVLVDGVPRPLRAVRRRRRLHGRAAADGAHPDPAALHRRRLDRGRAASSPTSTSTARSSASGWRTPAFGLPLADVPAAQLHRLAAVVDHRVGQDRRRRPLHDLLAARRAAVGARARRRSRSSSSCGCGTTCWSPTCSSAARRDTRVDHDRAGRTWSARAARTGTCSPRPRSSRWRCRCWCSSRCSATSCAASPPGR